MPAASTAALGLFEIIKASKDNHNTTLLQMKNCTHLLMWFQIKSSTLAAGSLYFKGTSNGTSRYFELEGMFMFTRIKLSSNFSYDCTYPNFMFLYLAGPYLCIEWLGYPHPIQWLVVYCALNHYLCVKIVIRTYAHVLTVYPKYVHISTLQWCHNGHDGVSNQQPLFTQPFIQAHGIESSMAPVTGKFPLQMACTAEDVSIWWRHHVIHYSYWCGSSRVNFNHITRQVCFICARSSMPVNHTSQLTIFSIQNQSRTKRNFGYTQQHYFIIKPVLKQPFTNASCWIFFKMTI